MCAQHAAIVAVVTTNKAYTHGGGAPIFVANDFEELQNTAMTLEKILDAATHEVNDSTLILVAH